MLSARLDGELILLHERRWEGQESLLRAASREGRLLAPCCGARLILKWGQRKVRHLAHPPRAECAYDRWSEPESPEHLAGKILLYEWCRRVYGSTARLIALEYPLAATQQRPDLYMELADGTRYALEYQRSAISPGEWAERHAAYEGEGIHDIWILGENRLADALPSEAQQARWAAREPHMRFLKLRAFESAAAVRTPFEVAWWRGDHQEELWEQAELDARVGREVNPWYRRSALQRLRSVTFLDAHSGDLMIYRAMRELPGRLDTKMASTRLQTSLEDPGLELSPSGFLLPQDHERLERHERRVERLEAAMARGQTVQESPAAYVASSPELRPLPAHMPLYFQRLARGRAERSWPADVDARLFHLGEQEEEQQRRLAERAGQAEWRKIVDRFGLSPENLHYLVGVPIPDDTAIAVHRTVWQAFICYRLVRQPRVSLATRQVAALVERLFGLHEEMTRLARYRLLGTVNTPEEVVGRFLLLLADAGYLRSDRRSEHLRFYGPEAPPPAYAFADRKDRWKAWAGLLQQKLRREEERLVGEGGPIGLKPALLSDRPTPAQVEAVARVANRLGVAIDLDRLTYTEASRILNAARRQRAGRLEST